MISDRLPYPDIPVNNEKEKAIVDYLLKLKEALEFALNDIGFDNLTLEVAKILKSINNTTNIIEENSEAVQQINNRALTISDVINSALLKNEILSYKVNLDTGELYKAQGE